MKRHTLGPLILAALVASCAQPAGYSAPPYPPVPPPQQEAIPNPPVTATPLIWQPGHYDWNGSAYVWIPGSYVPRDGHSLWQPGYWAQTAGGWTWQPGHWM
jgi:hypothetical protein